MYLLTSQPGGTLRNMPPRTSADCSHRIMATSDKSEGGKSRRNAFFSSQNAQKCVYRPAMLRPAGKLKCSLIPSCRNTGGRAGEEKRRMKGNGGEVKGRKGEER